MSRGEQQEFWAIAKECGVIEKSEELPAKEVLPFKHIKIPDCSYSIMEQICAMNEEKRKLRLERLNHTHHLITSSFSSHCEEALSTIENMNSKLDFVLRKKDVILHLRQNKSKIKETLPIPGRVQGLFINTVKQLADVTNSKLELIDFFRKKAALVGDLKEITTYTEPYKFQLLQILSMYECLLDKIKELETLSDDFAVDKSSVQLIFE
ncbi:hypothetical protein C0J52_06561 [Blattella germanica]|nr:hypothetical protein C0J52_06561 [Blattella germanica]